MFTPQRKAFPTPHRVGAGKTSGLTPSAKGKAVAVSTEALPPPPLGSLSEASGEVAMGFDAGNLDDWMKFREAGLLDEAEMQRKDQEALYEKVSRLERELFDYQYNMGLLLIEKKEWSSKFDELRQALDETEEILKRERSAHLIAYSEAEKRAENLRIALSTEKQCGEDLERALREMQKAHAQVQSSSHSKLAEANALVDGIEEKSSVVNKNLHDAEAKLAEVNRKNSELDMKLRELEVRESLLQKERLSLATEESFEATFYKQREDLKEWERKLRQREDIVCDGRQNFVGREMKAIETEKNLKQKERDLEVLEKKIDSSNSLLKVKEAEISKRVADLDVQEKEVNSLKSTLEMKEKALLAMELKLSAREREGIQKLLAEQKDNLDLKLQEFDLEMEQKRKSLIEEFSSKEEALEQREVEVNHRENKVGKEEQALSKKAERIKEQNKELEARLTSLKEKEKTIKIKEKELEKEKQQLLADRESLENLNVELGKIKAEISQQELQICQETENLKLTEEERSEHSRLQLELQQEIEHTRLQKDFLMKEAENLREERQRFEKEWDALDEKKAEVSKEHNEVNEEKERLGKLQNSEEERLKREKQDIQDHIKKELEKLELEKESFRDSMKQEELLLSEKVKNEKAQMLENIERKTRNLKNEIQKRQEEMEKDLQEREKKFQEEMEREINNINVLKGDAEKEWEEVKSEGIRLENERKELESNKQQLKSGQREIHEDSKMLMNLSRKVKKERECLMAERNNFLALVEKLRSCNACGEVIGDFVISDIQLPDCKERCVMPLPTSPVLNDRPLKNTEDNVGASDYSGSVRPVSWIRKCTSKIFKSPSKRTDAVSASDMAGTSPLPDLNANTEGARVILQERQLTREMVHLSSETPLVQSDNIVREVDNESQSIDHSYVDSLVDGGPDDSQQSVPKLGRRRAGRKSKSGIVRTRSVKAVVKEANEFLGKASGEIENASLQSLDADHVKDSQEDSSHTEKAIGNTGRKRQRAQTSRIAESEQNAGDSDGQSDSITTVGRRKKRQTVAQPAHVTGEKRYNLRRHKTTGEVSSTKAASKGGKSVGKESIGGKPKVDNQSREVVIETSSGVADDNVQGTSLLQVSTAKTVEFSDDRVVRFQLPRDVIGDDGAETTSVDPVEENARAEHGDEDGSRFHEIENDNEGEEEVEAEEGEEDEEEEDDEDEDPGEVSIGKKIYKFFTT
ncbi:protein CROWDED NUCLEI 3 isoform X2 [Lotus japonicus]|uniref:protein CROWDED NUCLEI 3 isoform X2 n=1 Tax=Lotus japonicus TaxID=34305 RepID=UPI002586FC92|nr:protein CROWDED NUCLEI 3 isoform X2 [Lotus japonicus]